MGRDTSVLRAARGPLALVSGVVALALACSPAVQTAPPPRAEPPAVPEPTRRLPVTDLPPDAPRARRELVLLGTTDVHNRLYPYDYYTRSEVGYGLALLKPVIDSIRAAHRGSTFLFDSGDLLQGNPLGFVYARQYAHQPNPVIRAMNLLGYNAAAIGNHEYNYGIPHLERAVAQAKFPFISANTFRHGTNQHAFAPFALLKHGVAPGDTITIGVTGNTPPGVHVWDKANVEGKLQFREIVSSLRPVVDSMRRRGADLVVVLSHGTFRGTTYDTVTTGLPAENAMDRAAREIPGIDVVFLGHSHQEIADSTINGVLFTQAGEWAKALSEARVTMERVAANEWRVTQKSARLHKPTLARADTAFLDSLRWEHERAVQYVNSVVGRATATFSAREGRTRDTPLADFINTVQMKRTGAELSATPVFVLGSKLPAGPISVADVAGVYHYENTLKAIQITGAQLKQYLEQSARYFRQWPVAAGETLIDPQVRSYNFDVISGIDYTIDLRRPVGERITALSYRGTAVRPEQTFKIALNNYRQSGGGGFSMLAGAPVVYDKQEGLRELLIEEIQRAGTVQPGTYFRPNWRIVPEAAARAAQTELDREVPQTTSTVATKRLRVLGFNDFHGRLLPEVYSWSEGRRVGGAAALGEFLDLERAGFAGPSIIVDAGDVMQGTPISNLTFGRSTIDFYNRAGVSVAAIGNHDFDWTIAVLRTRMQQAKFPWLSANIYNTGTSTRPVWARPWTMLDVQGVKVGVIGLSTENTPEVTKAENVRGLDFTSGAREIDRLVPELRRRGADFVIVTTHAGGRCERDAISCTGEVVDWARRITNKPDLIVAGHSHQIMNTVENGVRIVQAWDYSKKYSVVDLEKRADGSTRVWVRGQPTTFNDLVEPDSVIAAMVTRYERQIGPKVNEVITELTEPLRKTGSEYTLGHLIADAQRAAAQAQVAIMNNGGIRTDLEAGPLTWGELFTLQPFANRVMKLTVTGAQLRQVLETVVRSGQPGMHVSGMTVHYNPAAPVGARVQRIELTSGEVVRDDGRYTLAINDFLATGGDNLDVLATVAHVDVGVIDLDALITYLRRLPRPVRLAAEDRIRTTQ